MKTAVAVTLIIAGAILALAPYVANVVGTLLVTLVMVERGGDANIRSNLPIWFDAASFFAGVAMILVGTLGSFRSSGDSRQESA